MPFPKPAVLGHEVSGVVVAHGAGSTVAQRDRLPVGARAVGAFIMPCLDIDCFFCQRHDHTPYCNPLLRRLFRSQNNPSCPPLNLLLHPASTYAMFTT